MEIFAPRLAVCTHEQCLFNFLPEQGMTRGAVFYLALLCVLGLRFFLENTFFVLFTKIFLNIIALDAGRYSPLNNLNLF